MRKLLLILLICPLFVHAQNWQWARTSAGTEAQGASSNATDRFGNIYMTGYSELNYLTDTGNSIFFGANAIISTEFAYNYLVKYNGTGMALWLKKIPYSGSLRVATDSSGNVFLAGSYYKQLILGGDTLAASDTVSPNVYVAKLDSAGAILWLHAGNGAPGAGGTPTALATDDAGNVIVAGTISDSVSFGGATLHEHNLFTVKYGPDGGLKWANALGGHPQYDSVDYGVFFPDIVTGIATDHSGNIALAGSYKADTFTAGAYTLINRADSGYNAFVIKCDSAGGVVWANTIGGAASASGTVYDNIYGTATDSAGNIYIAGSTNSDVLYIGGNAYPNTCGCGGMLLAKYDTAGALIWLRPSVFPGGSPFSNGAIGLGVAAYGCWSVYVVGLATDTISFGAYRLPPAYYIVNLDTTGTVIYAAAAGNLGYFNAGAVAADTGGNAYMAGTYYADCSIGSNRLELTGASNAFLAKYNPHLPAAVAMMAAGTGLSLYPNPAMDKLNIAANSNIGLLTITNTMGQTVYSGSHAAHTASIDISALVNGIYFVRAGGVVWEWVKK